MPELPEVEVTRRSLAPALEGSQIRAVELGKPLRWPLGIQPSRLKGCVFGPLVRRGKYLWMPLIRHLGMAPDSAGPAGGLLVHLGMSGSLGFCPSAAGLPAAGPHDHVRILTDRGALTLTDPRRFGAVVWSAALQSAPAAKLLASLGREPDDPALTPEWFHAHLHGRRAPIKQVLLAGDVVVGAGNIYACEALFDAGIDPRLAAHRLSRPRAARLLQAVQHTLAQALSLGGSTLRDFRDAHGLSGAFQDQARVYGREGLPCTACGTRIRRVVMGQRSTFFCPKCQRR
jgi:formamidopyrimidine-DNA glycosylase